MPMTRINLSLSATAILQALAHGYQYGFDIMEITGLPSGTVYPALRRLEKSGVVESRWEDEAAAHKDQRPARKYYKLTGAGKAALSEAIGRYRRLEGTLSRKPKRTTG
jgi:PadR family transcriptional regulator, regulatory protein PadR